MNKTVRCKIGAALVGIRGRGPDLSVPTPEDGRPRSGPTFLQQIMADSGRRIAARKIVSVMLCYATVDEAKPSIDRTIFESDICDSATGEGGAQWVNS